MKIERREFITLLGGSAAAWPLAAHAQQPAMPVVGILGNEVGLEPLRDGLRQAGYVEGRNVALELREAGHLYDRLPELAADLVRRQVAVIVAVGTTPVQLAAKAATTTIPIVFSTGSDPIRIGLVKSLSHPGGNATGVTNLNAELIAKRLELLHEVVPAVRNIAVLINPTNSGNIARSNDLAAAARTLGVQLHIVQASTESDFDGAFASLAQLGAGALVIVGDGLFVNRSERLGALAIRHAVPAIFQLRRFAAAGGLMSYGTGTARDMMRMVGVYTGRILKGEKPADLPVQQVSNVELVINLKTAKALGLTVPLSLRGRADEVIE